MFRTSCVHHQEDLLYMQLFMVSFSCIYVSSLARLTYTSVHEKRTTNNCMYKRSSWWWTHDVQNM